MHAPVLLKETITALDLKEGDFVVDGTLGGGGHAEALLRRIGSTGTLLGIDWDEDTLARARAALKEPRNAKFFHASYVEIPAILAREKLPKADALLLDLGLSSDQLEASGRGFSFRRDEPLDMRYDRDADTPTAAALVSSLSARALAEIFRAYGEERRAERFAKAITDARRRNPIRTSGALAATIERAAGGRRGKIHPATQVFMALRIAVNRELENVKTILARLEDVVKPGGRAAIISFHSLEDRLVKEQFRARAKEGRAILLTKKPIRPSRDEAVANPRSRSAKLRVIELNY